MAEPLGAWYAREVRRPDTSRRVTLAVCGLLAVAAGLIPASASAAPVTFGSSLPAPSPGYSDSCVDACTTAQIALPGANTTSPVDGRVVRFRLRTAAGSDAQTLRFRVLRSSDGVNFTGVGTSAPVPIPTTAGTTTFPVNLPIRRGDYIGIDQPGGGKQARVIAVNDAAFQGGWFPALADGGAPRASGNPKGSVPTRFDLLLQADVEPTPTPTTPAEPLDCTSSRQRATCSDPNGLPSMCGPTGLGFPQCNLPFDLPTACSGTGTAFPVCNLPGNHIVACGGLGLLLPLCNLPKLEVPGVCGPTTAGLPPCGPANTQVLACGPVSLGLPACGFKTAIKAPAPIEPDGGAVDLTVSCPKPAAGTKESCDAYWDLLFLPVAKGQALFREAQMLAQAYSDSNTYRPEWSGDATIQGYAGRNAARFINRAASLIDFHTQTSGNTMHQGGRFHRLTTPERNDILLSLRAQNAGSPNAYLGPTELWDNAFTYRSVLALTTSIVEAVDDLYVLQESRPKPKPSATSVAVAAAGGASLVHKRFKIRRGARKRVHIRLSRRTTRRLLAQAPARSRSVAVRMVVAFKAKPRPIVRFVDFRLPVRQRAKRRR
jgi:hypothetical protein